MNGRTVGAGILSISIFVAIAYTLLLYLGYGWPLITVVVSVATLTMLGFIGWIGWMIATTPAPKPIELETSDEAEETGKKRRRRNVGERKK